MPTIDRTIIIYYLNTWFQNATILLLPKRGPMPSLTIKNVPTSILERLKAQAASHRRSLNLEVITCLEAITHSVPLDSDGLLARFRAVRVKPSGPRLTDRVLKRLKSQGRS